MDNIIQNLLIIIIFFLYPLIIFFEFLNKKYIFDMFLFFRSAIITMFTLLLTYLILKNIIYIRWCIVYLLIYFVLVVVEKIVICHILLKQFNYEKAKIFPSNASKLMFLFLSPDYVLTYYAKNTIYNSLKENDKPKARTNYIKLSNLLNIMISFSLTILVLYAKFEEQLCFFWALKNIMMFRMISRAIEIIISFISDIIQKKHNSSLSYAERTQLALFSFSEVLIMTFSLNVIFLCKNESIEFLNLLLDSIKNLFNFPLKDSTCIDIDYNIDVKYTIQILEYLTCYSLLGIVLSSYISDIQKH